MAAMRLIQIDAHPTTRLSRRTALAYAPLAGIAAALSWHAGRDALAAQESPAAGQQDANTYSFSGPETRIELNLGGEAGRASLSYDGPDGSQTCSGDEINVEDSALGRLVTCMVGAFPDRGQLWVTVLLPRLNPVEPGAGPTPVSTLAILRWEISTIAGPPREGALDTFAAVPLEGTAEYRGS